MFQANRPQYTASQILQWLELLGIKDRISKEDCDAEIGLKYLNKLIPRQQYKVPFENLDLHYSLSHHVSLDSEFLFDKVVGRKAGRGGYCMQNNNFFGTMLRSLGYQVLPVPSRVSSAAQGVMDLSKVQYEGWSHTVNIVYVAGQKYFADVGFGANCPAAAIPLVDGWTGCQAWNDKFDDMKLEWGHIAENTIKTEQQKVWIYYKRFGEELPWMPMYCFSELECTPADFRIMNYYVSHSLSVFFTHKIMVVRAILDDSGDVIGDLILFETVIKARKYGESEVLAELKSEEDRVQALEKYFDIKLSDQEIGGMRGYVSMIR